jgi:hypothetical protein
MLDIRMMGLTWALISPFFLGGQSLSPTLIGSAGAHADLFSFGSLDWSVGEPVVTTLVNGDILTQGFHQVFVAVTSATDQPPRPGDDLSMRVFPNPTAQWVNIESSEPVLIRVLDLRGVQLMHIAQATSAHSIDLSTLAAGTYLLEALTANQQYRRTFKLAIIR